MFGRKNSSNRSRLQVSRLEAREVPAGIVGEAAQLATSSPVVRSAIGPVSAVGSNPLSSIPALSSLPGAAATLYIDFDGHTEPVWGSYSNVQVPAYDQDGNTSTFSNTELANIRKIWEYVAEDFAPFNINVTTVQPGSFANGVSLRVAVGGDGSWTGGYYGGIGYIDSFTNYISNTAFGFPKNLLNGNPKYVGDVISHEAGHSFGLEHQSQYNAAGEKIAEYYRGPGDGRGPLMGRSYEAGRSIWWNGTSAEAWYITQDDMSLLARPQNGFGYRADDHGNAITNATPLNQSGTTAVGAGVITTTSDVDVFSFNTGAGRVTMRVTVPAGTNNLDTRVELRDANNRLITSAAPTNSFGATVTATVAAGSYRLIVASNARYGDVGTYAINGTIVTPPVPPPPPPNISINDITVTEGDGGSQWATFTVSLSTTSTKTVSVKFATANGSAIVNEDYIGGTGTITFNPGETSKPVSLQVLGDVYIEPNEAFLVNLSSATNGVIVDGQGQATIVNNDSWVPGSKATAVRYNPTRGGLDWYFDLNGDGDAHERILGFGLGGDTPVVGDWNRDGRMDVGVVRANYARGGLDWYLDLNNDGYLAERVVEFGLLGDVPVAGDWNSDGRTDVGVVRKNLARGGLDWYLDLNNDGYLAERVVEYGLIGDVPVVGDWNSDGRLDLGAVRKNTARGGLDWYLDLNNDGYLAERVMQYGLLNDQPIVGDWNNDGRSDLGVVRGREWLLDLNNDGYLAERSLWYGLSGDIFVAAKW